MATCSWCKQEMMDSKITTCGANINVEYPDGEKLAPVPYNPSYGAPDQRCHDCNIAPGGFHHPGCDMERCPRCGGQLIGCGCLSKGEEEE